MKILTLTKRDAALLREFMPEPYDSEPGSVEKEWQKREREAGDILRKIIESVEGEVQPEAMQ